MKDIDVKDFRDDPVKLLLLVEKLPIGVLLVDMAGRTLMINPAARQMLEGSDGFSTFPLIAPNVNIAPDSTEPADRVLFDATGQRIPRSRLPLMRTLLKGESVRNEEIIVRPKTGRESVLLIDSTPTHDAENRQTGAIAFLQDITLRRQAEERVRMTVERERLLSSLSRQFVETSSEGASGAASEGVSVVSQKIARIIGAATRSSCLIRLLNEEKTILKAAGWCGAGIPEETFAGFLPDLHVIPATQGVEGEVLASKKPVRLSSSDGAQAQGVTAPDGLRRLFQDYPAGSLIATPLCISGQTFGTMMVWRPLGEPPYSEEDTSFYNDLSDRAALSIENARLYADEVHRNRELNALHDATSALLSTLDIEVLLGRILDAAQRALPAAQRGVLFLVAPRTGRLEVRAMLGFNDPRIRRAGFVQNGRVERAIREKRPLLINDSQAELGPEGFLEQDLNLVRSAILAPLFLENEIFGCLALISSAPFAFSQADLRLLVSFAATTTAAIHNAMLHAEVQKIAITDALTGIYNRRGLEEMGRHEMDRFQRFGHPLSVILFDIDHFKDVNDQFGHAAGDQVLRAIAERCRSIIRQVDLLGRYGGEEFVALLPETDLFQAVNIAERLRKTVAESPFVIEQGDVSLTISLGVTRAGRNISSLAALIEQADAAMYDAKLKGRNRVEIG